MVAAEACGKHKRARLLADFALRGIAADNIAVFILYII